MATPKEMVLTDARKLIRTEKNQAQEKIKDNKLLAQEIEKFRTTLELERAYCKIEQKAKIPCVEHRDSLENISSKKLGNFLITARLHEIQSMTKKTIKYREKSVKSENDNLGKTERIEGKESSKFSENRKATKEKNHCSDEKNKTKNEHAETMSKSNQTKMSTGFSNKEEKKIARHKTAYKIFEKIRQQRTLSHYWMRWKLYVASRKEKRREEEMWRNKIHKFMQRCSESYGLRPAQSNQHKKTQKNDNRLSQNQKLGQPKKTYNEESIVSKAIAESANSTLKIASKIQPTLTKSLRSKAKLIRQFATIPDKEMTKERNKINGMKFSKPEILFKMDLKHNERKQRMALLQENRLRIEEEKDRIAKEKYQRQLYEAELEKQRKVRDFRRRLRQERLLQEKKRAECQRIREWEEIASNHYKKKLLQKYGFAPWRRLTLERKRLADKARDYNLLRVCKLAFNNWRKALEQIEREKTSKAINLRHFQLKRQAFEEWKNVVLTRHIRMQVAEDWNDYFVTKNAMNTWLNYVIMQETKRVEQWKIAVLYHKNSIVNKCFKNWMLLPQIMRLERAKEQRKKEWREKVLQVLPDFCPAIIYAKT